MSRRLEGNPQAFEETQLTWPIIVLPEDRRPQLTAKLEEYKKRMNEGDGRYRHPDMQLLMGEDAAAKAAILERVLKDGRLDTRAFALELKDKLGDVYDSQALLIPALVIYDYCETGGKRTAGGTGLPQVENPVKTRKTN